VEKVDLKKQSVEKRDICIDFNYLSLNRTVGLLVSFRLKGGE
jgi:hypothetical protein